MGEEKEKTKAKRVEKKNEAGEKPAGGGKNGDGSGGGSGTILLKLDLHCEGCAKKVRRCVRHFEGVEDVKADSSTGKLTVKGNVDPLWLREKVEIKTKKKVALLSTRPKKVVAGAGTGTGNGGEEKKSGEKVENNKVEEKKGEDKKPKKVQCNTEEVRLHCDGSAQKVKRFIIKKLKRYLKYKSKHNIAVVPPKKGDKSGGQSHNKKKKEVARGGGGGDGDGGRKKEDGESTGAGTSKSTEPKEQKTGVINNKMEYGVYTNPNMYYPMPPRYNQNYSNQDYGVMMNDHGHYGHSTGYMPALYDHGYSTGYVSPRHFTAPQDHGYGHTGYMPLPYTAPQYFSDENPNACSVM